MYIEYIAAVASALSVFLIASVQDLREREVSDILWMFLGAVGFILIGYGIYSGTYKMPSLSYLAVFLPAFLFADMFIDWERIGRSGTYLRYAVLAAAAAVAGFMIFSYYSYQGVEIVGSVTLWILLIFLLYFLDVIKGGADAKALVSIAVLFPVYPPVLSGAAQPFYTVVTFPFFLSVLMMGAVFSLVIPLWLFLRNSAMGERKFPEMFLGLRKGLSAIDLSKEWLLERVGESGLHVRVRKLGSVDEAHELESMKSAGWRDAWVSPKIPFMVPLTIALLFVLAVGNPILYI